MTRHLHTCGHVHDCSAPDPATTGRHVHYRDGEVLWDPVGGPCALADRDVPVTGPAVPSDEELRRLLVEMFGELLRLGMPQPEHLADALLPVVRRYADQRAAEELRGVASGVGAGAGIVGLPGAVKQALGIAAGVIYVRADELAAEATA